jgi:hypothetical protein
VVSFTARPIYPRAKSPRYPLERRLGGPKKLSGRRGEEKVLDPTGTRIPTPRSSTPLSRLPLGKVKKAKLSLWFNYEPRHEEEWGSGGIAPPSLTSELDGCVGFQVFTAVVMKSIMFWDVTPFSLLSCNRRFGGTYRLNLQGRRNNYSKNQQISRWQAEADGCELLTSRSGRFTPGENPRYPVDRLRNNCILDLA